jgi:hypothetical protein
MTYISDSGVPYQSNLLVSETKTIDNMTQGKRVTFSYTQRDGMGLPEWKDEFDYSSGAFLRRTGYTIFGRRERSAQNPPNVFKEIASHIFASASILRIAGE